MVIGKTSRNSVEVWDEMLWKLINNPVCQAESWMVLFSCNVMCYLISVWLGQSKKQASQIIYFLESTVSHFVIEKSFFMRTLICKFSNLVTFDILLLYCMRFICVLHNTSRPIPQPHLKKQNFSGYLWFSNILIPLTKTSWPFMNRCTKLLNCGTDGTFELLDITFCWIMGNVHLCCSLTL